MPLAGRERLFRPMQALGERSARVAFDNNHRPRLCPEAGAARDCYARAFALADLALVTADDHQAQLGRSTLEAAAARNLED